MDSFFVRYRNFLVLAVVLVVQIVGLAVQVHRTADGRNVLDSKDSASVQLIRYWAESVLAPSERGIHGSKLGIFGFWQTYIDLRNVRQQNQDLTRTIDRLRIEQASLLEDAKQGQRLQAMLGFQQSYLYSTLPAQVIGSSGSDQSRVFYINKGTSEGVRADMAVITADGIVGKVRDAFPHTAQVLAVNDQTSGAGVILENTRLRGILRGNASGQLAIVGLASDQRIQPGERVLTAGGDMIFPRGLPVGIVLKVLPDPDRDSSVLVLLKPAAHLNRLDEVLVITSTAPRFSDQQRQDLAASEAIAGAEAAALKDQQKASQIMAARLPGLTDPNLPAPQPQQGQQQGQSGQAQPVTPPVQPPSLPSRAPVPLHPDRFSPVPKAVVPKPSEDAPAARPQKSSATPRANGANRPATHPAANGRNQ